MGTLSRYSPTRSTQSCAATESYGSAAIWSSSSSRSGPRAWRHDERDQRVGAVVSAAASSLRRVVAPRLERARALPAAAVLARTACATTGAIPAPPIEGAGFGPTPARPHGAPAAPSRFRHVVEHQPTARVRALAESAGIAAREQLRRRPRHGPVEAFERRASRPPPRDDLAPAGRHFADLRVARQMLVQERDKPARMRSPHRPGHEPPPQRLPEPPQPLGLLTGGAAPQRAVRQYPRRFRPGRDVHGALEEMHPAVP